MRGLALEGGGARGAYHIGVVKAFMESGYEFDGFVGTSIGAVNAAILAQGCFDKALELWTDISMEQIFDVDERQLLQLMNFKELKFDTKLPSNVVKAISKILDGRGVNTAKMKAFLEQYIDEEKIRESGKDFGLVTVSMSERKPQELMLNDIPRGRLVNYIMASASFPGFHPETIDEKVFLDGGLYNNCPVNLLLEKGYDEVIAVRTRAPGITRKIESSEIVKVISAQQDLGNIMLFSPENSAANIKVGYFDGLRFINNLRGNYYYINLVDINKIYTRLMSLDDNIIQEAGECLGLPVMPPKRMLFEKLIPALSTHLKLGKDYDYADFFIALLEYEAKQKEIDRYFVYDFDSLCSLVKCTNEPEGDKSLLEQLPISSLLVKKKTAAKLLIGSLI